MKYMRDLLEFNTLEENMKNSEYSIECENEYKKFVKYVAHRAIDEKTKVIYLCGQSSSGKTTTTLRLKSYLERIGQRVHLIELDNFFLPVENYKLNKKGLPDFESIFSLDLPAIYKLKKDMDTGKKVEIMKFDFKNKKHSSGEKFNVLEGDIVIIEGIHAFNRRILKTFGEKNILKVFITVNTNLRFNKSELDANELRFIRRLVRDYNHRNSSPDYTIKLWKMVRAGEKRYAKGYIEKADIFKNSFLNYEPYVFNEKALQLLEEGIKSSDDTRYFTILKNKISKLSKISDVEVPVQSILNEFI